MTKVLQLRWGFYPECMASYRGGERDFLSIEIERATKRFTQDTHRKPSVIIMTKRLKSLLFSLFDEEFENDFIYSDGTPIVKFLGMKIVTISEPRCEWEPALSWWEFILMSSNSVMDRIEAGE